MKKAKTKKASRKTPRYKLSPFALAIRVAAALEERGWNCGITREERRESYAAIIKAMSSPRPVTILEKAWGKESCGLNREERASSLGEWHEAVTQAKKA